MDYYQGVVVDYLRADRSVFVNPECCIQLVDQPNPDGGTHWYCDAVAIDLRNETVFLCEISFAKGLNSLVARLRDWATQWEGVKAALVRDCHVHPEWTVRPWLFVREDAVEALTAKLLTFTTIGDAPVYQPRITTLEAVQPWKYKSWDHQDRSTPRPDCVPDTMRQ